MLHDPVNLFPSLFIDPKKFIRYTSGLFLTLLFSLKETTSTLIPANFLLA